MSLLKTLDQNRAAYAWDCIEAVQKQSAEDLAGYRDLVRKLPALIHTNGLGQALAFLMVQKNSKRWLYLHLETWLCVKAQPPVYKAEKGKPPHLMRALNREDSRDLRRASQEALALAAWLKRFAEAAELDAAKE